MHSLSPPCVAASQQQCSIQHCPRRAGPCEMQCFAVTAFTSFSFIAILIQIQANQVKVVSSEAEPTMSTEDPEYITLDLSRNDFDIGRTETLPKWTAPSTTTSSKQKRMRKRSDSGRGSMSPENDPLVYRSTSVAGEKETRRSRIFEETGRMDGTKSQIIIEEVEKRGFKKSSVSLHEQTVLSVRIERSTSNIHALTNQHSTAHS